VTILTAEASVCALNESEWSWIVWLAWREETIITLGIQFNHSAYHLDLLHLANTLLMLRSMGVSLLLLVLL
jgi:hypothetical protein